MALSHSPCPGREAIVHAARDLSPDNFRRLVAHRARQIFAEAIPPIQDKDERQHLETRIRENSHQDINVLSGQYLTDGAERIKAVCRIVTTDSFGTGCLVARGLVVTSHYILPTALVAAGSRAEFELADSDGNRTVILAPERFFITDETLDFTIIACSDRGIEDISPIPLRCNPATLTRYETVSIIQCQPAQTVTLHSNRVDRITDKTVRYCNDNPPVSSGSPIFNCNWELVALNHAGWTDNELPAACGSTTNEGIRIAAIVAHLCTCARASRYQARALAPILNTVSDTSPYLGFFNDASIGNVLERQAFMLRGNPDFADVGFWHVEDFNRNGEGDRVAALAKAIARLSPDLLGLAGVERPVLEQLVQATAQHGLATGFESLSVGGDRALALLYDRETTVVTPRVDIYERFRERLQAKTPDGKTAFPHEPLFVQCRVRDGNQRVVEFVTIVAYFDFSNEAQSRTRRRLAAKMLAKIVDDIRDRDNMPVILGGNCIHRTDADVFASLQDTPDSFILHANDESNDTIATFSGRRFRSSVDHIVISRDLNLHPASGDDAAIAQSERSACELSRDVSDCAPMLFRLIYRDSDIISDPNRDLHARRPQPLDVPRHSHLFTGKL